jgi:hypothetical protein
MSELTRENLIGLLQENTVSQADFKASLVGIKNHIDSVEKDLGGGMIELMKKISQLEGIIRERDMQLDKFLKTVGVSGKEMSKQATSMYVGGRKTRKNKKRR